MKVKKKVSKKLKSSWRKHVDVSDVEAFLDNKRLEERLGKPFDIRADDELFQIDTKPAGVRKESFQSKKERARNLPLKCFSALENSSAVPDPLIKRNRVRTKVERQHPILKKKNEIRRKQGILKKKELKQLNKYLQKHVTALKDKPKRKAAVEKDIWGEDSANQTKLAKLKNWMNPVTVLHTVRNVSCFKKTSNYRPERTATVIPSFEVPHPGISYNPSFKDHLSLANEVAQKEEDLQKKEAHLNRVTQGLFKHITEEQNEKNWIEEMSEGLPIPENASKENQEDESSDGEYKAINAPVTREKKKTLKKRKKELRLKQEELKRKEAQEQKKKALDICRVNRLMNDVLKNEKEKEKKELKRLRKTAEKFEKARRVGRNKLIDDETPIANVKELTGSLREIIPAGNILKDKFLNMQKRSLIEVVKPQFKKKKRKVKKYQTQSHRLEPTEFSAADVVKKVKHGIKIK